MSDKSNKMGQLADRLKSGLSKINQEAKDSANGKPSSPTNDAETESNSPIQEEVIEPIDNTEHAFGANQKADDSLIDEADFIEAEPLPQKKKRKQKQLGMKQKLLLVAGVVVAGVVWQTFSGPSLPPVPSVSDQSQNSVQDGESLDSETAVASLELDGPALGFGGESDFVETDGAETLNFGGDQALDPANDPIGADLLAADMNEHFGALEDESNEVIDPFTGEVMVESASPLGLDVTASQQAQEPARPDAVADFDIESGFGSLAQASPFDEAGSKSTELSGTKNQKPDSGQGELLDQNANADVAKLTAQIAEKDGRIGKLEDEVGKLKKHLALAKKELEQASANNGKAAASKAHPSKPVQAAQATQRSTPVQRVAKAPKAVARPQICVTAVAQAARNCTTCVPHAFVSHRGNETMLGQGDYIEGLRVSIVGDRLDLQNANGETVHKFWSSPNGCAG